MSKDNVTQYQFELVDVAKLLLKKQGISEGLWTIGVNFNVLSAMAGPTPEQTRPSMIVGIEKILMTRMPPGEDPTPLTVDASKL